ncbi:MAG: Dabb family protein [Planctomycetaceae bacterium]|nr:Dabb family protein [Planctomycetaceae bacterium]
MKFAIVVLTGLALVGSSWVMLQKSHAKEGDGPLLRHVVLFTFTEDATEDQINKIVEGFRKLPEQIEGIADFEWGTNNSPEGLTKGHTHCFLVTFKTEEARDAYLPHPAHQAFVTELKKILDDVTVIDYWVKE